MGVVHHAAYLPYLEAARVEYLRSIGHPYDVIRAGSDGPVRGGEADATEGRREFPVLEMFVRYRRPVYFDEEVEVALRVGAVTCATFQIAYLLTVAGVVRATAVSVHGCIDGHGRPARLPGWVTESGPVRATPT